MLGQKRLIRFCIVGMVNTLIDFGIFVGLYFGLGVWVMAAHVTGFLGGMCNSYLMNKYWTFGDRTPHRTGQIVRFIAITGSGLILSTIILYLGKAYVPVIWAKIFAIGIVLIWNYSGNRLFVFSQGETRR